MTPGLGWQLVKIGTASPIEQCRDHLLVLTKYHDDTRQDEGAAWNGG